MRLKFILYFSIIIFSLLSCIRRPGSGPYTPISKLEENEFKRANRNIFPGDVQKNIKLYTDSLIVWPGIILNRQVTELDNKIKVEFTLEHHYYDWIEDYGIQRAKIFLSPKGEGIFQTSWFLEKGVNISELKKLILPGNLVIVYGHPAKIEHDNIVFIKSTYIRVIDKQWYRTDIFEYGRRY